MTTCVRCRYEDADCEPCALCRQDVCPACSVELSGQPGRYCRLSCAYVVDSRTDATTPETVLGLSVSYDTVIGRLLAYLRRLWAGIGQVRG